GLGSERRSAGSRPEGQEVRDARPLHDSRRHARCGRTISGMSVSRSSGLDFLDDAAMEAFHSAAPFGPPPPGLLGNEGTVTFPFGFYGEAPGTPPRCRPAEGTEGSPGGVSS